MKVTSPEMISGSLVLGADRWHSHPEKQCRRHHRGQREGQDVVDQLKLAIAHGEHLAYHSLGELVLLWCGWSCRGMWLVLSWYGWSCRGMVGPVVLVVGLLSCLWCCCVLLLAGCCSAISLCAVPSQAPSQGPRVKSRLEHH